MLVGRPRRGRRNEERAWGFEAKGISKGLGAFGAGISKGLRAWAPSRNVVSPRAYKKEGKKVKTKS